MAEKSELSPVERTVLFFSNDVRILARAIQGMEIVLLKTDKRIKVDQAKSWLIKENDGLYRRGKDGLNVDNLPIGTFWALYHPLRKMRLSLITARETGEKGACIQLEKARSYNPRTGQFDPLKRQGDIADYLELEDNETGALRFGEEPNVLYLDRSIKVVPEEKDTTPMIIDSEAADRYMKELLGE